MFKLRVLSFIFGLPLMLLLCYLGGWWLFGAAVLVSFIGLYEWSGALRQTAARPNYILSAVLIGLILLVSQLLAKDKAALDQLLLLLIVLAIGASFISRVLLKGGDSALLDVATTLLTPLYIGLLFSFMLRLRESTWPASNLSIAGYEVAVGFGYLVLLFLVCWIMDTGAYLCGKFIGGAKLCPAISPGKTIAGLIGALITAAAVAAVGFSLLGLSVITGVLTGLCMGLFGQLGDLSKSLIKREVGIKDFGSIVPGHGGILDRFDNFLFNAPLLYYVLHFIV